MSLSLQTLFLFLTLLLFVRARSPLGLSNCTMDKVTKTIGGQGVVMFSKSSCCLCYTVDILLRELGVKPVIYEIDKDPEGREMEKALLSMGCQVAVPAVFIDGVLVGSTNEVISLHLSGNLSPKLKPYQSFNSFAA